MHNLEECATTARTIWKNVLQLPAQSGRMCYNCPHNLEECATTARTIWKNVLQLPAQSDRMSIIGEGIALTNCILKNNDLFQLIIFL